MLVRRGVAARRHFLRTQSRQRVWGATRVVRVLPRVSGSGAGCRTATVAIETAMPLAVPASELFSRLGSQESRPYPNRALSTTHMGLGQRRGSSTVSARWLQVLPDSDAAARRAADFIAGRLRRAVAARDRFCLALSGGSTPIPMFGALAAMSLPWRQVEIYQVHEQIVPEGSENRNLTNLRAAFGATGAKIIPMPVESVDLASAATAYEEVLPGVFDLVHLGLGLDGHTASLVPGDPVLDIVDRDVALCGPYQGLSRMTLTYRGLSKATEIIWLVTGADKAAPLARLCTDDREIPAGRVRAERVRFVTDAAAVQELEDRPQTGVHLWHRRVSTDR
jgi:6-phosphogluconolactonase